MTRDQEGRSTSIKKIKRRAREIRDGNGIALAKAQEQAAQEAGYKNYHEALKALGSQLQSRADDEIGQANAALRSIVAFIDDDRRVAEMSKALSDIYFAQPRGLPEFALAHLASLQPDVVAVLGRWIGTALNSVQLNGARFGTNIALIMRAGEEAERPLACSIGDFAKVALQVQSALRVADARVSLSPVAMLGRRGDDEMMMADWLQVARDGCGTAEAIADGKVSIARTGKQMPHVGSAQGSYYVFFGRATAPMSGRQQLEHALNGESVDGITVDGETSDGRVTLAGEDLGTADQIVPWLYGAEIQRAASYAEYVLADEGLRPEQTRIGMQVWPGESPRRVDVVVHLPDDPGRVGRTRSTELGRYVFPLYLHMALQKAFGTASYKLVR